MEGSSQVITLSGRVGLDNAAELRERLSQLAQDPGGVMIIDASELTHINSMGLGSLVVAHQKLQAKGGQLRLAGPSPSIRQVMSATALDQIIPIYSGVAEALRG